ncbi:MAG: Asp-tRNA(Asn)/Glu-tRNA(Gln) amidotransferase subunit GatB [Malacoplasma sp.]
MINNLKVIIGIEIHVVLNSKTKMFSSSKNDHSSLPNTNINPIDLGLPGTMPSPNFECIKKAIIFSKALNMEIDNNVSFDRKNYFYRDLPKGYQITQYFSPIGKNGYVDIDGKKILVERVHLEEDTAKQNIMPNGIFLDYNRAGLPLIEIVSTPTISSPKEAASYLKKIRRILMFNNISDAKLEDGSMRADINISLMPIGSKKFGTKVEIKNINSISNVEKAINFEIDRQTKLILTNEIVLQETRRFNDSINATEFLREKTDAVEYRYMTEPNIYQRHIDTKTINQIIDKHFVSIDEIQKKLESYNISSEIINIIFESAFNYEIFNEINKIANNPIEVSKWLFIELNGLLAKDNKTYIDLKKDKYEEIGVMIQRLVQNKLNGKQCKEILRHICSSELKLDEILSKFSFSQIDDESILEKMMDEFIKENIKILDEYENKPEKVNKFFLGLLMKETKGQANPQISMNILQKLIKKYLAK